MHTAMKNPIDILKRAKHFITEDIWKLDIEDFSRAKARSIKYLKVLIITIKTFSAEKIGFQAVALSFFGTMSVVPFLAVVFAITDGLGLADKLESSRSSCTPISATRRKPLKWSWASPTTSLTPPSPAEWGF